MNEFEYVITYFGTGMTAMEKRFTDFEVANAEWERMKADPWQGAFKFEKIELIDRK